MKIMLNVSEFVIFSALKNEEAKEKAKSARNFSFALIRAGGANETTNIKNDFFAQHDELLL